MGAICRLALYSDDSVCLESGTAAADLCRHTGAADAAGCLFLERLADVDVTAGMVPRSLRIRGGLYHAGAEGCGGICDDGRTCVTWIPASGVLCVERRTRETVDRIWCCCGAGHGIHDGRVFADNGCPGEGCRRSDTLSAPDAGPGRDEQLRRGDAVSRGVIRTAVARGN